jgi:hypothetical protein
MDNTPDTPQFVHDCKECVFLGRYKDNYDLYFCSKHGHITVIGRFGNEGWEYSSGIHNSLLPELVEAKRRAKEKDLI